MLGQREKKVIGMIKRMRGWLDKKKGAVGLAERKARLA
jgi:hypothetical protein